MKTRPGQKIKMASLEELLGVPGEESASEVDIRLIHSFKNHPFKVVNGKCFSIKNGIYFSRYAANYFPEFAAFYFPQSIVTNTARVVALCACQGAFAS